MSLNILSKAQPSATLRLVMSTLATLLIFVASHARAVVDLTTLQWVGDGSVTFELVDDPNVLTGETRYIGTLRNHTDKPVTGPFYFVAKDITHSEVSAANADNVDPEGSPIFIMDIAILGVDQTVERSIVFNNVTEVNFSFAQFLFRDRPRDDDDDGVENHLDACPGTDGGKQVNADGCAPYQLDSDNDEYPDSIDACPNTPEGAVIVNRGCAASQLDGDNDGVTDDLDQCAFTPEGESVNTDGCALSQLDSDNDEYPDSIDACPNTPEGAVIVNRGCAASQLDGDNDGVSNDKDLCHFTPEGEEVNADGCALSQLDSDNDEYPDSIDACPNTPEGAVIVQQGCAASQLDGDNDGVSNDKDLCHFTPEGEEVNADGCALSQLDSDNDEYPDSIDACPNTPEGAVVDKYGCGPTQKDGDNDGVTQDLDLCPGTPAGATVNADGCAESQLDDDNDDYTNDEDACPNTPAGAVVDKNGCSASQLDADNDGVTQDLDLCPATPVGAPVNTDGCAQSQLDDDNDDYTNDEDACPNTPAGAPVDKNGCSASQIDADNDGVTQDLDLCPATPAGAPVNADGCAQSQLDDDNDDYTNDEDACPNTPAGAPVDKNGCSPSQIDADNDGVTQDLDLCPNTPQGEPVDSDGCSASQQDKDSDNDGVIDAADSCPNTPAGEPVDAQGCSSSQTNADADNDGVLDSVDACPNTPAGETVDANGCSTSQVDSDNDGVLDNVDACPNTPAGESVDANGCSTSQVDSDNDGVFDNVDACPNTPAGESVDANGCSTSQVDSDNDGVFDNVDACPNTPAGDSVDANGCSTSQVDSDNDGVLDNVDACPNTPAGESVDTNGCSTSQVDSDNDGVFDNVDACPNTPADESVDANGCSASQVDSDNDGVFDNVDACPNTPAGESVDANGCSTSQVDSDNDGVFDNADACPNTPAGESVDANGCSTSQVDSDNDGVFDNADACPNTPAGESVDANGCSTSQVDSDNDGILDSADACPNTPVGEGVDANGCSASQLDSDNDGVFDNVDTCPNTPAGESVDSAGCAPSQLDSDGDGVADVNDLFPNDPAEWADLDSDGIGDNSDTDRDGDGYTNQEETAAGTNPDDANDVPDYPALSVFIDGNPARSTDELSVLLSGVIVGDNISRVYLRSDRLQGIEFAASLSDSAWQARVPLELGVNVITAHVQSEDREASSTVNVLRNPRPPEVNLIIESPVDGSLLTTDSAVFVGRIVSESPVDPPLVSVNGTNATATQGSEPTEFSFTSAPVALSQGNNVITVSAVVAGQSLLQTVQVVYQPEAEELAPPVISVRSPTPGTTLTSDSFTFTADIIADAGLASVTLNGQSVAVLNGGIVQQELSFASGQSQFDLSLVATDNRDQSSSVSATYRRDTDLPIVQVNGLQPFPEENTTSANPIAFSGTVTDSNISQLTINGEAVSLTPSGSADSYTFDTQLGLTPGASNTISVLATDTAGNSSALDYLVVSTSTVGAEWLSPADDAVILLQEGGQSLELNARIENALGSEIIEASLDGQITNLSLDGIVATGSIALPSTEGEYTLGLEVRAVSGEVLASISRVIRLQNPQDIDVAIVKIDPQEGATDLEPNGFFSVFFNQPIDMSLLQLSLNETAHGLGYINVDPPGVDSLQAQGYQLRQINRDHEAVPGVSSLLPNNSTALFYPERDLAYGAELFFTVTYDGEELARRAFQVRPQPTFVEGIVVDNLGQPVAGVEVKLPSLGRTTVTNVDGAYAFGYGDTADNNIPGGNYRLYINADLKDRRFGSYVGNVNVQAGTRNRHRTVPLVLLNKEVPFTFLSSGESHTINGGEVVLDATEANFRFPNQSDEGAAHVQFLTLGSLREPVFDVRYTPRWVYGVQPSGIRVDRNLHVTLRLPKYQGSYDYAPRAGELVVLLGKNNEGTRLIPVGVGETSDHHTIQSVGTTHYENLDYLAYARVLPEQWIDLKTYTEGEMPIEALMARLQVFKFQPPANEAEAIERAKAAVEQLQDSTD